MTELGKPPYASSAPDDERWARETLSRLAFAAVVEQRRSRRWGIFFKLLFFFYLVLVLLLAVSPLNITHADRGQRHTALINVDGLIAAGMEATAENVVAGLREAFKNEHVAGVILHINSPGGSPVQAGEMYDEIMRLRAEHPTIPVYAVAGDVCASGGYYVAAAAQRIYANKASIIGSIGVRTDGFGFEEAMAKLGITRRLYTAGANKGFLDPFQPPRPEDIAHIQAMLGEIHEQFISAVREGRGERLRQNPDLFSGLVWTGEKSMELGLIDGLADIRQVAKNEIKAEKIVDYTQRRKVLERLLSGAEAALGQGAAAFGLSTPVFQ